MLILFPNESKNSRRLQDFVVESIQRKLNEIESPIKMLKSFLLEKKSKRDREMNKNSKIIWKSWIISNPENQQKPLLKKIFSKSTNWQQKKSSILSIITNEEIKQMQFTMNDEELCICHQSGKIYQN